MRRGHFVVLVVRRFIKSEPYSKKVLNAVSLQCTCGKSSVAKKNGNRSQTFEVVKLLKNIKLQILSG